MTAHCLDWTALPAVAQQHVNHPSAANKNGMCVLQQWAAANGWRPADLCDLLQAQVCMALRCEHAARSIICTLQMQMCLLASDNMGICSKSSLAARTGDLLS